jgi:hypothetical protein
VSLVNHKTFGLQIKFCEDTLSSRLCRATSPQGEACVTYAEHPDKPKTAAKKRLFLDLEVLKLT